MANPHFMSPRYDETALLGQLTTLSPVGRERHKDKLIARRLLLELRAIIQPHASWMAKDFNSTITEDAATGVWQVSDSTTLPRHYARDQSIIPGGTVRFTGILARLDGSLCPACLILRQGLEHPRSCFMTLRNEVASAPLESEFNFPASLDDHPLDALKITRGDLHGRSLRYVLDRYDS